MKSKKKKLKLKKKNLFALIIFIMALVFFIYSLSNIVMWLIDSPNTKKDISNANDLVKIKEVDNGTIIPSDEPKTGLYWDFIKMNLIEVDLSLLKKENKDTIAWLQVPGTNINYPVVQYSDNDYYLTHSYKKGGNKAGWIFMDYRNSINEINDNTIIYGHNRKDGTMFGTLKNLLSNNWFNNSKNQIIKMSTEKYNTLWQIFSVYTIPTTNDYLSLTIDDNLLNTIRNRSHFVFNASVTTSDKILTLSTCRGSNNKLVVHAKLIKMESKL